MRRGLKVDRLKVQLAAVSLPCQLLRRSCDIIFVFVLCRIKFLRYISDIYSVFESLAAAADKAN